MNCDECGGRCCRILVLPPMTTLSALRITGVVPKAESLFYLSLHRGVSFRHGRMYLDADVSVVPYQIGRAHV